MRGTGTSKTKWRLKDTEKKRIIWPFLPSKWVKIFGLANLINLFFVDLSPILFHFCFFFIRSELVRVDPSWSDPDWRSELIRSDFCTCLLKIELTIVFLNSYSTVYYYLTHYTCTTTVIIIRIFLVSIILASYSHLHHHHHNDCPHFYTITFLVFFFLTICFLEFSRL